MNNKKQVKMCSEKLITLQYDAVADMSAVDVPAPVVSQQNVAASAL